MTATPEPKPTEPEPSALDMVVARHDQLCDAELLCLTNPEEIKQYCKCGVLLATSQLATLRADLAAAQKRVEELQAEHKRAVAEMLAMANINQARAQSAAQSIAKVAQELQIYLRENNPDVVKLEA